MAFQILGPASRTVKRLAFVLQDGPCDPYTCTYKMHPVTYMHVLTWSWRFNAAGKQKMYVKAAAATTTVLCQWGWNQSWLTCVEQNIFHRNKVYAQLFYETLLQYVMYFCNWFYQISIVIEWFYVTWILFVRIYWLFLSLMMWKSCLFWSLYS